MRLKQSNKLAEFAQIRNGATYKRICRDSPKGEQHSKWIIQFPKTHYKQAHSRMFTHYKKELSLSELISGGIVPEAAVRMSVLK